MAHEPGHLVDPPDTTPAGGENIQIGYAPGTGPTIVNNMSTTTQTTAPTGFAAMDPTVQLGVAEGAASGLGGILQYAMQAREAKKNLRQSRQQYKLDMAGLRTADTSNAFARVRNPYRNLTVAQRSAEFQANRSQQALVDSMSQLRSGVGSSGVAALAQAMANQQTQNMAQIAGSIEQQEAANTRLTAQGAMQAQLARAQGQQFSQQMEAEKRSVLMDYAAKERQSAEQRMAQLNAGLASGIGSLASSALTTGLGGAFK